MRRAWIAWVFLVFMAVCRAGLAEEAVPPAQTPEEDAPAAQEEPSGGGISLLERRNMLAEEYRRKILGKDQLIQVNIKNNRADVVFYLNRIFLPFSDVLSREGYSALKETVDAMEKKPPVEVRMRAVDNMDSGAAPDLSARRCSVIFSYFFYDSFVPQNEMDDEF